MTGLSIVALAVLVNAGAWAATGTYRDFSKQVLEAGNDLAVPKSICDDFGLERGTKGKVVEAEPSEAVDGRSRALAIIPSGAILISRKTIGFDTDDLTVRLDTEGMPLQAYSQTGKVDERGEAVRGSARVAKISLQDKSVKKRIAAELDFWLKGKGRKKAPAAKK